MPPLPIILVICLGFALWGTVMAQGRGYHGWLGFALGFCLGLLGILILALAFPSNYRTSAPAAPHLATPRPEPRRRSRRI